MQEGNKKEKWGKPKLIILIRGKPDEMVLQGCKTGGAFPGSPTFSFTGTCRIAGSCSCCAPLMTS